MADDSANHGGTNGSVVRFPQSRVPPRQSLELPKDLGESRLTQQFGGPGRQATGHWCSRCRGIWYGYLLEVTCPVCGSRHG